MDRDYKRAANITVIAAGLAFAAYLFFKYALRAAMPFLLAALIGAFVSPLAERLSKKTKIPKKITAALLLILILSAVSALIGFACTRLVQEVGGLLAKLEENPEAVSAVFDKITAFFTKTGERFGFLGRIFASEAWHKLGVDIDSLFEGALRSLFTSLTSALPAFAMGLIGKIPSILLFLFVTLISAFYFASDSNKIGASLLSFLPERWQKKLPGVKEKAKKTLVGYTKAYLLLMLLTFCQVFIGLTILRIKYAFLPALIIAVVDLLPVLGTGIVLVPWSIFSYIAGDPKIGTGLLILYAVILILRQLLEPKIVGGSLGLHPLATLASVYLGISLFGLSGIFVGPVVALFLKEVFEGG